MTNTDDPYRVWIYRLDADAPVATVTSEDGSPPSRIRGAIFDRTGAKIAGGAYALNEQAAPDGNGLVYELAPGQEGRASETLLSRFDQRGHDRLASTP